MGMTLQIINKTYCCVNSNDTNMFNEDLDEESDDDEDKNEDDNEKNKQVIDKIESFNTDINKSQLLEI